MKLIKLLLVFLFIIILLAVSVLGYFGFIPGLSAIFGSNKPRNLGVRVTSENYNTYVQKAGTEIKHIQNAPVTGKSFVASGRKESYTSFTPEEISGRVSFSSWKYMPVDNVQVKINPDGTSETSGVLRVDRLSGFFATMGFGNVSQAEMHEALKYAGIAGNPPFYAKVRASVVNNKAQVTLISAELGRFPIPIDDINKSGALVSLTNEVLSKVAGFYAKSVTFENGKMNFEGTIPETMTVEVGK